QQIDNRRRATVEDASDTSSVTVEPTTLQKGKGPDPRNWGGIASLLNEDIDVDRQRMALDAYARAKIAQIHINEPSNGRVEDHGSLTEGGSPPVNVATKGINSKPANAIQVPISSNDTQEGIKSMELRIHLPPHSFLGSAFLNISNNVPSSGGSIPSQSAPEYIDEGSSRSGKGSMSLIKLIPPKKYDGSPDAWAYHRFITESTDYTETGRVEPQRCVFVLSRFLEGRAYDFYTQKVAMNVGDWTLREFFIE
ncbi:hypothetical protein H0H87_009537, partial [Tephrocybe sp. NHM501043]